MAKQRPVPPGGRKPANPRDHQATPARPPIAATPPGPRRPPAGDPSDPRPIAAPFMQHPAPDARTEVDHPDQAHHGPAAGHPEAGHPSAEAGLPEAEQHASGLPHPQPGQHETGLPHPAAEPHGSGLPQPVARAAEAGTDSLAAGGNRPVRQSGRPMPSPRRTPPTENPAETAHPYPPAAPAAEQATPPGPTAQHEPGAGRPPADPAGPGGPEMGGAPAEQRRSEPHNVSPAAGRPGTANALPVHSGPGPAGNQRSFLPATGRRPETVGVAKVPPPRPLLPGLQLQPMVHVDDMAAAVAFYEQLGGEVNHGERDGEWVLMQVGTAQIGLVTRPPDASRGESTVELNFTATMPLDRLERLLRSRGVTVVEVAVDRDLGARLHVETPDGMPIKIHQVEPELMV
ncbi:VOC family protein [Actinoplanes auranticolor]|uniref:VOC domain-containing protein n=1 Tax=Actinoplanes auranticolor TaxID=47988 RepID=A0A919SIY6_9ACTN|nr:VOC family protein [Actinoplanes auranticolor]GIM72469.1 hypothetical protein Aau02nite_51140 [Actinoplanes auranticolor]